MARADPVGGGGHGAVHGRALTSAAGPRARWTVYILRCGDGSLYTGVTNDLARRVAAHRAGRGGAYTRARRPVRIVYTEARADRGSALRREAAIKGLSRREKLALVHRGRRG